MVISLILKKSGALLCSLAILLQFSCLNDSYWIKLSGPVEIAGDWIEFQPKTPLRAEKDFQWVVLDLEPPFKDDVYNEGKGSEKGKGILMPDGEIVNPELEITDQYGNKFNLVYKGSREGGPIYGYTPPDKLPRDREYKTIRIRSSKTIKCKAIYWFCESAKDWP
jgi:hypothetical protein